MLARELVDSRLTPRSQATAVPSPGRDDRSYHGRQRYARNDLDVVARSWRANVPVRRVSDRIAGRHGASESRTVISNFILEI